MIYTEIQHFSHQHSLKQVRNKTPYKCDGCQEPGWGIRYRCEECNYDLHNECAFASSTRSHLFYKKCTFQFLEAAFGDRYRNACGKDVLGFVYHCRRTGYDLHPCCANLPLVLQGGGVELHLQESLSSKCYKCRSKVLRGKVKGWSYKSTCGQYIFHVSCVKNMAIEKWENGCFADCEINDLDIEIAKPPVLQIVRQTGANSKLKVCWKIAKVVVNLIISILTGDVIGGVIGLIGVLR